jgi:hypothetical protein
MKTTTSTNTALIEIAGHRAGACIRKGQQAWTQIKATTEEQRTLWLEVGVALMYGKQKENRTLLAPRKWQGYCDWVNKTFPELDTHNYAPAALWYAQDFPNDWEKLIPQGMADPVCIQRWFNEKQEILENTDPVLRYAPAPEAKITIAASIGQRIAKLVHRAKSNDEGSPLAVKAITAYAKQHGVKEEELLEAAKAAAPEVYFQFGPAQVKALSDLYENQLNTVNAMKAYGFTREEIKNIFLKFTSTI